MSQLRVEKVQELMKQEISKIILRELKDPRIGFVTVTSVECTGDLREAKVYVSLMGRLRFTPELSFVVDKSLDYSAHIQELLLKIEAEDKAKNDSTESTEIEDDKKEEH